MPGTLFLRVHDFIPASRVNGPGLRAVLWVQGCSLGCLGCFNPETHDQDGGKSIDVIFLAGQIAAMADRVEGLSISGGEPFQQAEALAALCREIRQQTNLSILIFSGFEMDEIKRIPYGLETLDQVDVVIAGRYHQDLRLARSLRGSKNKTLELLTERYTTDDFESLPDAEVIISAEGEILVSGIDPLRI